MLQILLGNYLYIYANYVPHTITGLPICEGLQYIFSNFLYSVRDCYLLHYLSGTWSDICNRLQRSDSHRGMQESANLFACSQTSVREACLNVCIMYLK